MKLKQVVVMIGLLLMVCAARRLPADYGRRHDERWPASPWKMRRPWWESRPWPPSPRGRCVRAEPSDSAEVVTGIREGEQFPVIGRSGDGLWIRNRYPACAGRQRLGIRQLRDGAGSDHRCHRQQRSAGRHGSRSRRGNPGPDRGSH